MFERRIIDLTAASAEAGDLLEQGVGRALAQVVNEPLARHAQREEDRLRRELRRHVDQLAKVSPRELSDELDGWIDTTIRAEFEYLIPRFETAIAEQLTKLERRYAERIERIVEQIQQAAEDVFGTRASDVLPDTGLRAPSRFSFKLNDVEHALDMLVGFGRTITPGALGRRLVIRDAEQRLIDMADRHAGRLRSELAGRVSEAVRAYRRELSAAVDDLIERDPQSNRAGQSRSAPRRRARADASWRARSGPVPLCAADRGARAVDKGSGILLFKPRMQYTATTDANPVRVTFEPLVSAPDPARVRVVGQSRRFGGRCSDKPHLRRLAYGLIGI